MELSLQIRMNTSLYLKNPEQSDLGQAIIQESIILIHQLGFEAFTFKKLAMAMGTTEASIYRYFENKHRLLLYLTAWYWGWLEYQIVIQTRHLQTPVSKLKKILQLISSPAKDDVTTSYVNESILQKIVIHEGSKAYLTKHVQEDNQYKFFKPYKDLSKHIASIIKLCNPRYKYPRSLATSLLEISHFMPFFSDHLPTLTDIPDDTDRMKLHRFVCHLAFSCLNLQ